MPLYHSPHSSSFFAAGFFIALVPSPLGFFAPAAACPPTLENSSQKSFLSAAGPAGGAPKLSQKSFFSGSAREREDEAGPSEPSTKRLNVVPAVATPLWRPWPTTPTVLRA